MIQFLLDVFFGATFTGLLLLLFRGRLPSLFGAPAPTPETIDKEAKESAQKEVQRLNDLPARAVIDELANADAVRKTIAAGELRIADLFQRERVDRLSGEGPTGDAGDGGGGSQDRGDSSEGGDCGTPVPVGG